MRIALCSTVVPFVNGGARILVDGLYEMLLREGHEVERVDLPADDAPGALFKQMAAYRWIDLSAADRVICFRPQSHLIRHPNKILWFIHHIRAFYDMWGTRYQHFPDNFETKAIREALFAADTAALKEAKKIFTTSQIVTDRLMKFNGVDSEILYLPLMHSEKFYCDGYNDEIVCVARIEDHKRQLLMVEAMRYTKTPVRLRICGRSLSEHYIQSINELINDYDLKDKIVFEHRWISDEEKYSILAKSLAAIYVPVDEDCYAYLTIEAAYSSKALITTTDSGGILEFVKNNVNGLICEPTPKAIAQAMDMLYANEGLAKQYGQKARERIDELGVSWSNTIRRLLA